MSRVFRAPDYLNEEFIMALSRFDIVGQLKLANPSTQCDEMLGLIQALTPSQAFSKEERELFGLASDDYIQSRIRLWEKVSLSEQEAENSEKKQAQFKEEREAIEADSRLAVKEKVLAIAKEQLSLSAEAEHSIFFHTASGNGYAFLALIDSGDDRVSAVDSAQKSYQDAFDKARQELDAANPYRLYLVVRYSQFFHDILNAPDKACYLAKQAFDEAISDDSEMEQESKLLVQRLRDNLMKWTSDDTEPEEAV
jgi:hypothetical protein